MVAFITNWKKNRRELRKMRANEANLRKMRAEEIMKYVQTKLGEILSKYKDQNVCNVGPGLMCRNPQPWRKPGSGCCIDCKHHKEDVGCTIVNLCCMSFFCENVKDQLDPEDWTKFKSTLIVLQGLGLEPRDTWDEQQMILSVKMLRFNFNPDDVYNLFKTILG